LRRLWKCGKLLKEIEEWNTAHPDYVIPVGAAFGGVLLGGVSMRQGSRSFAYGPPRATLRM
jgi:hypothetical protein